MIGAGTKLRALQVPAPIVVTATRIPIEESPGKDSITVPLHPGALSVDNTPVPEPTDVNPGLLPLKFVDGIGVPSHLGYESGVEPRLPPLMLPIGQLRNRYERKRSVPYFADTGYVLVIDAVASAHPVWLIFDRNAGNLLEERGYIHPDTADLVFSGTENNVDAAQLLPSIQDLFHPYGNLSFTQIRDPFQKTGRGYRRS